MTDLLSGAEFAEWRSAINDAVDTFFKFTVTHCGAGQQFDRWSEENPSPDIIKTDLKCLVEYEMEGDDSETDRKQKGAEDAQLLNVSFGVDYLKSVSMWDTNLQEGAFDKGKDYFLYQGLTYRLIAMVADGPIDTENALLIITLEREEKNA